MDGLSRGLDWAAATVEVRGGTVAAQRAGGDGAPVLLLLGGATWSRDWWPDGFCAALVTSGLGVVRFDPRDTGESVLSPPGSPSYSAQDLVDDAIAVLDAFDVRSAAVLGLSMGGGLAQRLGADHPDRVPALVLASTSPAWDIDAVLPRPTPEILATFEHPAPAPDWTDRQNVVDWTVATERPYAGPDSFDEEVLRELVGRVWDRTPSMASAAVNHFLVAAAAPPIELEAVRSTAALVLHGSADPLFPLAHGEALAAALDARLLVLDGVGHQTPPPATWPRVAAAVARHVTTNTATP